ncbi:MAG TPA: ABC transporter permease [Kineosporiaceae bacterium]|jgi:peptide/nickel transport system permease protein|nr:ABC transporter permease [Kineosporiaceae bacterium]
MGVFVVRRLAVSFLILIASTFLIFTLVSLSGDPLETLRLDTSPNRLQKIEQRTQELHLDKPIPQRYLIWAQGAAKCAVPGQGCDLGVTVRGQEVNELLSQAILVTVRLVTASLVLALLVGITVGVVSALRQYSGFDYSITFSAFLFFSLPVFWVAVLLKQYLAIDVNNWYDSPTINIVVAIVLAAVSGLTWGAIVGGDRRRRWIVRGAAAVVTFALLQYLEAVDWFTRPALGPVLITVFAFGAAVAVAAVVAGLNRRHVLYACLVTAGLGAVAQFFVTPWLQDPLWASWLNILLLVVVAALVAAVVGFAMGGLDRPQAIRATVLTSFAFVVFVVVDEMLRALPGYSDAVGGRVLATIGSETPNFDGPFWQQQLDTFSHLLLPTLSILLISFATYSRYSRATMLETLSQDYVRTARAKGLTERTVVMRHAFRNALIPLTTLAAFDFGALLGGAVITETIFGWRGMGLLFVNGLQSTDPNPVMGFYIVTAISVVIFNMLADIAYAYLDPRIRLA